MPLSVGYDSSILRLLLNATAIANIADNAAASPSTAIWIALHEGSPAGGTQATNETAYTGYARIYTARTSTSWTCSTSAGAASPAADITFGTATTTSTGSITYASIGLSSSGAGVMVAYGTVPTINYGLNVVPQLTTSSSMTLT